MKIMNPWVGVKSQLLPAFSSELYNNFHLVLHSIEWTVIVKANWNWRVNKRLEDKSVKDTKDCRWSPICSAIWANSTLHPLNHNNTLIFVMWLLQQVNIQQHNWSHKAGPICINSTKQVLCHQIDANNKSRLSNKDRMLPREIPLSQKSKYNL